MNEPLPKGKIIRFFCDACGEVLATTRPGEMTCNTCGGKDFTVIELKRDKRVTFQGQDLRQHGPI